MFVKLITAVYVLVPWWFYYALRWAVWILLVYEYIFLINMRLVKSKSLICGNSKGHCHFKITFRFWVSLPVYPCKPHINPYVVTYYFFNFMCLCCLHTSDHGICIFYMFKALKVGNELMNAGRLKQALPYYEKVMQVADFKVPFYRSTELILCIKINAIIRYLLKYIHGCIINDILAYGVWTSHLQTSLFGEMLNSENHYIYNLPHTIKLHSFDITCWTSWTMK